MITRIGMVNYINTAPIYEVWKDEVREPDWQVVEAAPTSLNRMLAAGELELGFVSSYEYAVRPERYYILDNLSIAATGPVGSVFLFSRLEPGELDSRLVLLTGQSDTSVALLRLVLEEFVGITPRYVRGDVLRPQDVAPDVSGVLAIGDDALRLAVMQEYPVRLDLSAAWFDQTGLPFVFALCCVRQEYAEAHSETVSRIHATLQHCRRQGRARLDAICARVARRIPMDCTACSRYLQAMEYDLDERKKEALEKFFGMLIQRNEAAASALPLKLIRYVGAEEGR